MYLIQLLLCAIIACKLLNSQPAYASTALSSSTVREILAKNLKETEPAESAVYHEFATRNTALIQELQKQITENQDAALIVTSLADKVPASINADNINRFTASITKEVFSLFPRLKGSYHSLTRQALFEDSNCYSQLIKKAYKDPTLYHSILFSFYMNGGKHYLKGQAYSNATSCFLQACEQAIPLAPINPSLFNERFHLILTKLDTSQSLKEEERLQLISFYKMTMKATGISYKTNEAGISLLSDLYIKTTRYHQRIKYTSLFLDLMEIALQQEQIMLPPVSRVKEDYGINDLRSATRSTDLLMIEKVYVDRKDLSLPFRKFLYQIKYYNGLSSLAEAYYHLGDYKKAQPILESLTSFFIGNIESNTVYNHVWLSLLYAKQDKWQASFEQFEKAYAITPFCFAEGYYPEDCLLIIEVLLRNKRGRSKFIDAIFDLKVSYREELKYDIERVKKKISEERIQSFRQKYLTKYIQGLIEQAKQEYAEIDRGYQDYWHKHSCQNTAGESDAFERIDKYFKTAHEFYLTLLSIDLSQQPTASSVTQARSYFHNLKGLKQNIAIEVKLFKARRSLLMQQRFWVKLASKSDVIFADTTSREKSKSSTVASYRKAARKLEVLPKSQEKAITSAQQAEHEAINSSIKTEVYPPQIRSFKGDMVSQIWLTQDAGELPEGTLHLLQALNRATSMYHLRQMVPVRANLEILKGDRKGQLSLRINDRLRLCFRWVTGHGAFDVEITDHYAPF
ncbi:type II toxin-antitoxin system RelE/ParE family toxin [Candidatus Odyssella thessalonicensis]|uniref:type II toxin-antitoxin system RelE/ParE family toxin n=1 Tax=Candidatus Odyssella thessalonicensis TaxID=84647 RepID=UPI000225C1D0|nr:plasmid maintenance system killer [Candidatus Odyssella thessalonicensis]